MSVVEYYELVVAENEKDEQSEAEPTDSVSLNIESDELMPEDLVEIMYLEIGKTITDTTTIFNGVSTRN